MSWLQAPRRDRVVGSGMAGGCPTWGDCALKNEPAKIVEGQGDGMAVVLCRYTTTLAIISLGTIVSSYLLTRNNENYRNIGVAKWGPLRLLRLSVKH